MREKLHQDSIMWEKQLASVNLNRNTQLDMLSVVIPQPFIDQLIDRNPEVFDQLSPLSSSRSEVPIIFRDKRPLEKSVLKVARDI